MRLENQKRELENLEYALRGFIQRSHAWYNNGEIPIMFLNELKQKTESVKRENLFLNKGQIDSMRSLDNFINEKLKDNHGFTQKDYRMLTDVENRISYKISDIENDIRKEQMKQAMLHQAMLHGIK